MGDAEYQAQKRQLELATALAGGKGDVAELPIQLILQKVGLEHYYEYFDKANIRSIDPKPEERLTDQDVEQIIRDVEASNHLSQPFPREERVLMWKALRYLWFQAPGHQKPFVLESEVPQLFLPKRDIRQMDSDVRVNELDPDRQRQIIRRKHIEKQPGGHQTVKEVQFEIYRRQIDVSYEMADLRRSVTEWQSRNPRTMLREDPREEVMKSRIIQAENTLMVALDGRKSERARRKRLGRSFLALKLATGGMSIFMFVIAYMQYQDAPSALQFEFITASKQFISGMSFFVAFWMSYGVSHRMRADPISAQLEKMLVSCGRLLEEINDFRVESENMRMKKQDSNLDDVLAAFKGPSESKVKKKDDGPKKRKKRKKKEANAGYFTEADLDQAEADWNRVGGAIWTALQDSYKRLPDLPPDFRRNGGERMDDDRFASRMGGQVKTDLLVHRQPPKARPGQPPSTASTAALGAGERLHELGDVLRDAADVDGRGGPPLPPPVDFEMTMPGVLPSDADQAAPAPPTGKIVKRPGVAGRSQSKIGQAPERSATQGAQSDAGQQPAPIPSGQHPSAEAEMPPLGELGLSSGGEETGPESADEYAAHMRRLQEIDSKTRADAEGADDDMRPD
eukprot:gnl/TRDRNA2_/TRDRNA2_186095_c0_seq1.p1 gnl/TRDRNA2_/TRDRNA2_186095_c0~~gnl/TRDRNA2_/TRDRNA2_186095_c0_seq1.p1  ORF type:complete len:624 (+),score=128.40 gnl/TRDRNA2_/TRDRNA2_186095_c0_seq1:64-1935(+)